MTLLSDGGPAAAGETLAGLPLLRLAGLRPRPGQGPAPLKQALEQIGPQAVIWNLGLTSLLYQDFSLLPGARHVGVFTSPIYRFSELARLGPLALWRGWGLSAVHVLGALLPRPWLRRRLERLGLAALVTQTRTTRRQLQQSGLWRGAVQVIPPGVDPAWQAAASQRDVARLELGFAPADCVVAYFGPPDRLRGLPVLLEAFERARRAEPALRLLVLSRPSPGGGDAPSRLAQNGSPAGLIRVVDGSLEPAALALNVAAADLVALPFELVPSDAPLSLLEAQALGKPLVVTRVACLPELAAAGPHCLAEPGDPASLAQALLELARQPRPTLPAGPALARGWSQAGSEWSDLIQSL